jgi:Tfp pilus assembly protein PilO
MNSANRIILSMLVVAALAVAFWVLALGPKRQEAEKLSTQINDLHSSLSEAQTKAAEAIAARRQFPADYRQLVVLGKAVPPSDETSTLLYEINQIAHSSKVTFQSIQLAANSGESSPAPAVTTTATTSAPAASGSSTATPTAASVPATETAASLLPLGATIGPAGLAVMPYNLIFTGNFFHVANFIRGVDSLLHAKKRNVAVDGRLVTLNGFALNEDHANKFPHLEATFSVTTYLTPSSQGVTAGASPSAPAPSTATPTATTTSSTAATATPTSNSK